MAKHKRSIWEDLLNAGRRMLKELEDLFDVKAPQNRKPARVPVPVNKRRKRYENE